MCRVLVLSIAVLSISATALSASAKSDVAPGNYILYYSPAATLESAFIMIKVEHKGGKDVAEVIDAPKKDGEIDAFEVDGKKVNMTFHLPGNKNSYDFQGTVSAKDSKLILGNVAVGANVLRGMLVSTEHQKIEAADRVGPNKAPEPMQKFLNLRNQVSLLAAKMRTAPEGEERNELVKKWQEARKASVEHLPSLFRELLEKHGESVFVLEAVTAYFPKLGQTAKPNEAANWLKKIDAVAEPYGPRFQADVQFKCASALVSQKGFESLALDIAERLAKNLTETTPAAKQVSILKILHTSQEMTGKLDLAKQTEARLEKIETVLDKEYIAKVPPFKPKAFEGRKAASDKVVVMELFTGAQCPPCVAADVAFDALQKTYKPTDVIFLQYHMHIPGPDPLTNGDTEARWKYYGNLRGTPSTLLDGKIVPGGGGVMAASESKFKQYDKAIGPLLEKTTTVKLTGKATAKGDKIAIKVDVDGLPSEEKLKLRFVLVEESIRYVGGNGLRFHHHVVRALPGGADGMALKETKEAKTAEVDLSELRKTLTTYLDDYAKLAAFPYPDRPLALKNLHVVALVQNDANKEILQAIQLEIAE